MTEVERIVNEGFLPESFFDEEMRCGFHVTKERKKIWAIEMDLFTKLFSICEKHNLKIWGDGGTLLGAVRHNGFIPWDDDIDVIMPRKDYDTLMELGNKEFEDPYFLQTPYTDSGYYYSYCKFRNSNTTGISKSFMNAGFNQGVFIDIFPLDYVNLESFESDKARITECIMRNSSFMKRNSLENLDQRQLENYYKYNTENPLGEFELMQKIAANPLNEGSEYVANCMFVAIKSSAQIWKKSWFEKTVFHKFENIEMPMPYDIEARLTTQYGDYMQFPPIEHRGDRHSDIIWDPDRKYTEYIKK